ncbi:hypothetical protein KUTeg_004490 [Tegillarca granosa]|uniref:Cystatin domain-containing protein n=1 Tax=Tegillarca granosa TaxID=220873 RepID=A0ABQ9FQ39_TEGGR|nr:hypothetical protein KUTeg_004490 [Tegillarca granosa]
MISSIVVFLAVNVAVAFSQLCCSPPQWEGMEGFTTGYVEKGIKKKMEGYAKISYDAQNSKLAANTNVFNGETMMQVRVIMDFQKKKQYTIVKEKCSVTKLQTPFPKSCIPDGSEKYPAYFGMKNDGLDTMIHDQHHESRTLD